MRRGRVLLLGLLLVVPGTAGEDSLPDYRRVKQLSGTLRFAGSSVVAVLVEEWIEGFEKLYPDTVLEVSTGGSSTALAALLSGKCEIAGMSRPLTEDEIATFKKRFGYAPTAIPVAFDAISVYVHRDNPIKGFTLAQLDSIYSVDRKRGGNRILTWGDAGLTNEWAERPIRLYGYGSVSGAYPWIRKVVLDGGEFRASMLVESGSAGTVNAVGAYRGAIAFAAHFYETRRTRVVPIAREAGGAYLAPTRRNSISGKYPLARCLFLIVNTKPDSPLPALVSEFVAYVCSDRGQRISSRAGGFAISAAWARANLKAIGREPAAAD